ncbi:hypothetical protein [Dehalococcoides mccartyi]|jgi:hypothetical protein|uniref:Alpha/beta hydrolase n=1 Tax=Dehalococcoides mccartyi TaxID=61435 RepID=A0A142VAW1_9CHLR|nr:hypothetical protein [Dehalococcoides mccartyi]AII61217.1 hypothetical protein X794_05260 [Dehalococcoides mccartyi CG5]AMU86912.1 hypothetical protein Dm11a5_1086 [Dehalococcoides mccartyi]AOV99702.1 hypothetical protein DCWBC2_1077 [Dehalococcoides mccartyi]MBA2085481.1 hypothetical protein [Dehalococcoides mccartyi]QBX64233.1 hypothetical protein DhcFL2_05595 [Dehalococcoides mccartyi]
MDWGILKIILGIVILLAVGACVLLLADPLPVPGIFRNSSGEKLDKDDLSEVPENICNEAAKLAVQFFPDNPAKQSEYQKNLLAAYLTIKNIDLLLLFNPGGFGYARISASKGWESITTGISGLTKSWGLRTLVLDYQRTAHSLTGKFSEVLASSSHSVSKARELSSKLIFLLKYLPNLKIVLGSESNGSVSANNTLLFLKDNPSVVSIETGPPVWHKGFDHERRLLLRSNGLVPDSFSYGDIKTILSANFMALFGRSPKSPGNVLLYIGAPGHEYSWEHAEVKNQITNFLTNKLKT